MLTILFLSLLCTCNFVASQVDPLVIRISECAQATNTPIDLVEKSWLSGSLPDIEYLKEFYYCYSRKGGFLSANGKYQPRVIKKAMMERLEMIADRIVDECTRKVWSSDSEMAVQFIKCYHDRAPYGYDFKEKLEI